MLGIFALLSVLCYWYDCTIHVYPQRN